MQSLNAWLKPYTLVNLYRSMRGKFCREFAFSVIPVNDDHIPQSFEHTNLNIQAAPVIAGFFRQEKVFGAKAYQYGAACVRVELGNTSRINFPVKALAHDAELALSFLKMTRE